MTKLLLALLLAVSLSVAAQNPISRSASKALEPLQPVTEFVNAWQTGDVGSSPAMFYKDANDRVYIQGLVWKFGQSGSAPERYYGEAAFKLPPGYRPLHNEWFPVATAVEAGVVFVQPSGDVEIRVEFDYFTWVSLSGVSFRAAP